MPFQWIQLARALVARPRYLFADEPTGNLDYTNSVNVADAIWEFLEASMGVVMATHDLELAKRCDRMITLRDGVPKRADG